jgi:hypothetical protein
MASSLLLDPAVKALSDQIAQLSARLAQLERNQRSGFNMLNTSIENSALTVNDGNGTPQFQVGLQADGTYTVKSLGTTPPPIAPSTPGAGGGPFGIWVSWDGIMADGTLPLSDFSYVQVHVSQLSGFTPGAATLAGHMGGAGLFGVGQLIAGQNYYIKLVVLNQAGITGPASAQASAIPFAPGGAAVTVSSSAPVSPSLNDLWYDSANGNRLNQWNGTAWVLYQYGQGAIATGAITANEIANNTITAAQILAGTITAAQIAANTITAAQIAAGTITAAQIAASTITAAKLAAGIVYAGIVDATTIKALQYVASGASGQFLAYSGTPAAGNLIVSLSGAAGTDGFTNPFAKGVEIQSGGLILDDQGSDPPAVSGASVFYSSSGGRPRFQPAIGTRHSIDRSNIHTDIFTVGNTVTRSAISQSWSYAANEAILANEYEFEISGIISTGTGTAQALTFDFDIGPVTGGAFTIGTVFLVASASFAYTIRFLMACTATGVSGTCTMHSNGTIAVLGGANLGNAQTFVAVGAGAATKAFDTTAANTFQVYAKWAGTNTGETLSTYRTRISRRH